MPELGNAWEGCIISYVLLVQAKSVYYVWAILRAVGDVYWQTNPQKMTSWSVDVVASNSIRSEYGAVGLVVEYIALSHRPYITDGHFKHCL